MYFGILVATSLSWNPNIVCINTWRFMPVKWPLDVPLNRYEGLVLSVCGDGKTYTLLLETDPSEDDPEPRQYFTRFQTKMGFSRVSGLAPSFNFWSTHICFWVICCEGPSIGESRRQLCCPSISWSCARILCRLGFRSVYSDQWSRRLLHWIHSLSIHLHFDSSLDDRWVTI